MKAPVLICGAGIGGLTAGIALRQRGFPVRIFERASQLEPVGAGITVQVNAMRVMRRLGLADDIAAAGAPLATAWIRTWQGRVLRSMDQGMLARKYGEPFVAIHRARLQELLLRAVGDGQVTTGAAAVGVAVEAERAMVTFADGSTEAAPLVVGADGLHSAVRAALFGTEPLRAAEQIAWRGVSPRQLADGDSGGESWGRGARFGFVPISRDDIYWYAAIDAAAAPPPAAEQHAALVDFYRGWHAPIPDLIRATDPGRVLRTELSDRVPTDLWGRGPVTLLGDAAHPMTPNLGQGGCQAIEDAYVLARELARDPSAAGLRCYEAARLGRTRRFVEESWRFGKLSQASNPLLMGVRNLAMRLVPRAAVEASLAWSFGFDPEG